MTALQPRVSWDRVHNRLLALPGSPRGVVDSLEAVMEALPHGLRTLRGDVSDAPAAHRPS